MSNLDFVTAKIRGMRGKIYEGDALFQLCHVGTIEDLAAKLAPNTPVGDTISLQRHLTQKHVESLYRIARYLDGWDQQLFLWLLRRYQAENLKVLVRVWATKSTQDALNSFSVPVPPDISLPSHEMIHAQSMEELIMAVPERELREGALLGLGDYEETSRPFFIEAGIDKAYHAELNRLALQAKGESAAGARRLIELELDIYNVMFILRALFNYGVIFNKIRPFLAPLGALNMRIIDDMRNAPDIDTAAAAVPSTITGESGQMPGERVELVMWQNMFRVANRTYYTSSDMSAIIAFYFLKRVELANLIRISECIRYGERGDSIRQKLLTAANEPAGAV